MSDSFTDFAHLPFSILTKELKILKNLLVDGWYIAVPTREASIPAYRLRAAAYDVGNYCIEAAAGETRFF